MKSTSVSGQYTSYQLAQDIDRQDPRSHRRGPSCVGHCHSLSCRPSGNTQLLRPPSLVHPVAIRVAACEYYRVRTDYLNASCFSQAASLQSQFRKSSVLLVAINISSHALLAARLQPKMDFIKPRYRNEEARNLFHPGYPISSSQTHLQLSLLSRGLILLRWWGQE